MREHQSELRNHVQSAADNNEKSVGLHMDAVSPQKAVAELLPAKVRIRRNDDQRDSTPASTRNLVPYATSTTVFEDRIVTPTSSAGVTDTWQRLVASRNGGIPTSNVASVSHHKPSSPQHTNAPFSTDVEKQSLHASSRFSLQTQPNGLLERGGAVYSSYREPLVDGSEAKDHTPWILLYLSFLSPPLTFSIAIYTLLILFILLLLAPLSICTKRKPLRQQIRSYLLRPIDYQLYCLYHTSSSEVSFCNDNSCMNREHRSLWLITVSLMSPPYSLAMAFAVWIAASFWIYAGILGDPNDSGQNDNDGPRAVLTVRKWWCEWLGRAIKM